MHITISSSLISSHLIIYLILSAYLAIDMFACWSNCCPQACPAAFASGKPCGIGLSSSVAAAPQGKNGDQRSCEGITPVMKVTSIHLHFIWFIHYSVLCVCVSSILPLVVDPSHIDPKGHSQHNVGISCRCSLRPLAMVGLLYLGHESRGNIFRNIFGLKEC